MVAGIPTSDRPRVLVVEDEAMLAFMLEDLLAEMGCVVSHVAGRLQEGLSIAREAEIDFALLDVNLGDADRSFAIADELDRRGIPFAFVTGYGRRGLEGRFPGAPVVNKPVRISDLHSLVRGEGWSPRDTN